MDGRESTVKKFKKQTNSNVIQAPVELAQLGE